MKYFFYLLLFFPLFFNEKSFALFGDSKDDVPHFLENIQKIATPKYTHIPLDEAIKKELFPLYQKYQNPNICSDEIDINAIHSSIAEFLNDLNNPESSTFKKKQKLSLAKTLKVHGWPHLHNLTEEQINNENIDIRRLFVSLSRENKERLLNEMGWNPENFQEKLSKKERDLINKIKVFPQHRTGNKGLKTSHLTPLMSSKQLGFLGLIGTNTRYAFNREFIESDDNVFFTAEVLNLNNLDLILEKPSEYGNTSLSVERSFALEHGILSPFIMYPSELYDLALLQDKNFHDENFTLYEITCSIEADQSSNTEFFSKYVKAMTPYKNSLYKYDLTLEDYEILIKAILSQALILLKEKGELRGKQSVASLAAEKIGIKMGQIFRINYEEFIQALADNSLPVDELSKIIAKIPRYELKIPTALPSAYFQLLDKSRD